MSRRKKRTRSARPSSGILAQPFKQPVNNWSPYEILAADQIHQLHEASMTILETIGLKFLDDEALDIWETAGANVDRANQHVLLIEA